MREVELDDHCEHEETDNGYCVECSEIVEGEEQYESID